MIRVHLFVSKKSSGIEIIDDWKINLGPKKANFQNQNIQQKEVS